MALFVLGAGATRGCSFVDSTRRPCIPPLDADFFTQLQRVENPKHKQMVTDVMRDVVKIFGNNFDASLETVFATLEHTLRMIQTTGDSRSFNKKDMTQMRDRLLQAIALVLEESLCRRGRGSGSSLEVRECENHKELVLKCLMPKDDIITFNYDCTIDYSLKNFGSGKWSPRYGYGFNLGPKGSALKGDDHWTPDDPADQDRTLHLFKLHGSLHFQVRDKARTQVRLKQRPYTQQQGFLRFNILPPESNKAYDEGIFAGLWQRAAAAVKKAKQIVIIGYSLPPTDLHSNALFRTSIRPKSLRSLVIVNPDRETRKRTRQVLQRGFNENTRVLSFDSMQEFLAVDTRVWRVR